MTHSSRRKMSKSPNPEQLTLNARASGFRRSKVLINSTTSAAVRLDMSDRSRLGAWDWLGLDTSFRQEKQRGCQLQAWQHEP